ncbi:hypothetical protein ACH4SP_11750 [Streptomyces sp. NPDC021093]|uniref:hypothetical protein n=1 Tax=Streptomyces sp. NPDC021093 TaxID=3365112 RepID=UPI00378DD80A
MIARDLRVSERSVERWRRAWRECERDALASRRRRRRGCRSCPRANVPSWRRS